MGQLDISMVTERKTLVLLVLYTENVAVLGTLWGTFGSG
jgi:hypothetical protein